MNQLILILITIIHLFVVLFVVLTPFFGNSYVLFVHVLLVPFIVVHWILNNDSCVLTDIELNLRQKTSTIPITKNDCITCRVMSPIYNIVDQHAEYSRSIYIITGFLWSFALYKLSTKYKNGEIKKIYDLVVPKGHLYNFNIGSL